eukprot:jgi/Chrzof1/1270/Cz10g00010.t1
MGLSQTGSMKGADMFVLTKADNGTWALTDRYAEGFVPPVVDAHNDLVLMGLSAPDSGAISAVFRRKLTPCDTQDLSIYPGQTYYVLWAHGQEWGYHGSNNRGSQPVVLFPDNKNTTMSSSYNSTTPKAPSVASESGPSPSEMRTYNITMGNITIPAVETTYLVQYFKVPSDRKYHILRYDAVINSPHMHHAVVYGCSSSMDANVSALPHLGPFNEKDHQMLCTQFYMLVAPNNKPVLSPPEAGLPFGAGTYTWLSLEIHYNNPELIEGDTDSGSGITFEYTPRLRAHDMGLLTLSQHNLTIPPGLSSYTAAPITCPGTCTKRFNQPIHLVSQFYHMHGIGKSARTRRIRSGRELSPLADLHAFDYGFQSLIPIAGDKALLLPGDTLIFTCTFDSRSRKNVTKFGLSTQDEMCFHWVYYWPRHADMGLCVNLGKSPLAVCAADYTPTEALRANDTNLLQNYTAAGYLVPFRPAVNYTQYNATCTSQLPSAA